MIATALRMEDKVAEYLAIISQGERNIVVNDSECKRYENRKRFLEDIKSGNYHDLSADMCGEEDRELMWCVWIMESYAEGLSVIANAVKKGGRISGPVQRAIRKELSLETLEGALRDFARIVENEQRMSSFRIDKEGSYVHKWISHPEQQAKKLLYMSLKTSFGDDIKIFEELTSGAGKIDLYLQLSAQYQVIVELKMCGVGYSSAYAESGLEQLCHYMKIRDVRVGYLVVFDARKRDFGTKISSCYVPEPGMVIRSVFVDMRAEVK